MLLILLLSYFSILPSYLYCLWLCVVWCSLLPDPFLHEMWEWLKTPLSCKKTPGKTHRCWSHSCKHRFQTSAFFFYNGGHELRVWGGLGVVHLYHHGLNHWGHQLCDQGSWGLRLEGGGEVPGGGGWRTGGSGDDRCVSTTAGLRGKHLNKQEI